MGLAISWLEENRPESAAIITDSQSLCDGIMNLNPDLAPLLSRVKNYDKRLTIQWVPGHCGIAGNELADAAAKDAAKQEGSYSAISYKSACARIKQLTRDPPPTHDLPKRVYAALSKGKEQELTCRRDQVLLAKIRSGKTPLFRENKALWDKSVDPTCPRCQDGIHNLEHWLTQCAGTLEERTRIFGEEYMGGLELLTKHPTKAVALARSTLPGAGR